LLPQKKKKTRPSVTNMPLVIYSISDADIADDLARMKVVVGEAEA
jgi:hypothetical protein